MIMLTGMYLTPDKPPASPGVMYVRWRPYRLQDRIRLWLARRLLRRVRTVLLLDEWTKVWSSASPATPPSV